MASRNLLNAQVAAKKAAAVRAGGASRVGLGANQQQNRGNNAATPESTNNNNQTPTQAATLGSSTAVQASTPTVDPYLTATQIADYTNAVNKDNATIYGAPQTTASLTNTFDQNSATNGAKAQTSFNNTNQSDAARGFGFSGVHDTAMADINANAVMNQNNYNTAYKTGLATLANNVYNAQGDLRTLGLEYSGIANENATTTAGQEGALIGSTPVTLPTVATPTVSAPVSTPAPVTYFNNPNMSGLNSLISSGASAGTAAGVPS